jgi:hypothetical protein
MELSHSSKFCGCLLYRILSISRRNVENGANSHLHPWVKYDFHCTYFHETYAYLISLCGGILFRISPKSAKKYENYTRKSLTTLSKV